MAAAVAPLVFEELKVKLVGGGHGNGFGHRLRLPPLDKEQARVQPQGRHADQDRQAQSHQGGDRYRAAGMRLKKACVATWLYCSRAIAALIEVMIFPVNFNRSPALWTRPSR